MKCFTLHSNHSLVEGIVVKNREKELGLRTWSIPVGSPAPLGVYEEHLVPKIPKNVVIDDSAGFLTLMEFLTEDTFHMILIKNQSPIAGAWAFEKSPGVEVLSEGYVPRIRKVSQAPGCEYLIEMEPGSIVTIALAGCTNGAPKRYTLKADVSSLILAPDSGTSLVGGPLKQIPLPLNIKGFQWPK